MNNKKYFENPFALISDPFNKKGVSIKTIYEGLGNIDRLYTLDNDVAKLILNKALRECLNIYYYSSSFYKLNSAIDWDPISEAEERNTLIDEIQKKEYAFIINEENELILSSKESNISLFSCVINKISNYINLGGLALFFQNDTELYNYLISKTENLVGNPEFIIKNFCTNELTSLLFREYKIRKVNKFNTTEPKLSSDVFNDLHYATFKLTFSIHFSKKKYFIDIKEYLFTEQIEKFKISNRLILKQLESKLIKIDFSRNIYTVKYPNEFFGHGKKYNFYYGKKYSFIDILENDIDYIIWLMKNHDNFIIEDIKSYYKYFIPITDDIIQSIICNEIKLKYYNEFLSEIDEDNSFNQDDLKWMNDSAFEFDDDNYWNID